MVSKHERVYLGEDLLTSHAHTHMELREPECGNAAAKAGKLGATIQMSWPSDPSGFLLADS